MILKITMLIAALYAVYHIFKTKKLYPSVITLGMTLAILMTFCPSENIQYLWKYTYMAFVALALIYGFTVKKKKLFSKIILILLPALILMFWLWVSFHWHGNTMIILIIALTVGFLAIFNKAKFKNELGFIVILTADAFVLILENILKSI